MYRLLKFLCKDKQVYFWRFWVVIGVVYFGTHLILGYIKCANTLCPGDLEDGWVLEFVDEDTGQRMIKEGSRIMTLKEWEATQNDNSNRLQKR